MPLPRFISAAICTRDSLQTLEAIQAGAGIGEFDSVFLAPGTQLPSATGRDRSLGIYWLR
jgi:hypothetical protein